KLAADMVNAAGGVDGHPIEISALDVPGSDAVPEAIQTMRRRGVRFLLGSYGSTISRPAATLAARHGMLFWETGAVGEMSRVGAGRLSFRVAPTGSTLGKSAIDFAVGQLAPMF